MNILHITPAFYPATYWGGPVRSVHGLCNALARISGVTLRVLTTNSAGPRRHEAVRVAMFPSRAAAGYEIFYCARWWGASFSPGMLLRLWPMVRWADIVHLTAVYSPPTIPALLVCRLLGKPVVWSPRGALQRWERTARPLAKRVWEWLCNALISGMNCTLHSTSEQEAGASRARLTNAEVVVIPNGIDVPALLQGRTWLPDGRLRLLYLGRLHPIKGIENLVRSVQMLGDRPVSLVICGSGDADYSAGLLRLVHDLDLTERVRFRGYVDGEEKRKAFEEADATIVPSYSENFGMVVAESLAHGVPVIASTGTPWAELRNRGCGLWVDNDPASLAKAIGFLFEADLPGMGYRGRTWMESSFSWDRIAQDISVLYQRMLREAA